MVTFFTLAQQETVKGKILDKEGVALFGVSIMEKGTQNGTTSNFDGEYSIKLKGVSNQLVFSYLGYVTKTINVTNEVLNLKMEPSSNQLDEIIVTVGLRASQLQAIKDKRDSDDVIESITSEDIGTFSDNNTADALERVAGVQIERNIDGTGGDRISIQGLGPEFVEVTINGRSPLSAGDDGYSGLRQFNLDVLPTEIISGASINKTGGAGANGGIGGNVNFKTLRPLNMKYKGGKKHFGVISSRTSANSNKPELGSRNSMAFGGKINNKLGAFVTFMNSSEIRVQNSAGIGVQTPRDYRIDTNENGVFDDGIDTFYAAIDGTHFGPANGGNTINKRINSRTASSFGIQYKPNKKLDIMLDYTFTGLQTDSQRDILQTFFNGFYRNDPDNDNITLWAPDALDFNGSHLTYFDLDGAQNAGYFIRSRTTQTKNTTKSGLGGLNIRYKVSKKLNLAADVSFSTIDFVGQTVNAGTVIYNQDFDEFNPQDLSLDVRGDKPSFGFPNIYDSRVFADKVPNVGNAQTKNIGKKYQARLTADYRLNKNFRVNVGVSYDYSDIQSRRFIINTSSFVKENGTTGLTAEQLLSYQDFISRGDRTDGTFLEGGTGLDNWLASSGFAVWNADPEFASYDGGEIFNFNKHLSELPGVEGSEYFTPSRSYQIVEGNIKAFLNVRWTTKIFGRKAVLRFSSSVIKYDNASSGFSAITFYDPLDDSETENTGFSQYLVTDNTTINFLPSFNGTIDLTKRLKFRLAASKKLSRPRVRSLLPNNSIRMIDPNSELLDPNSPNYNPNDPEFRNTITAGNANLVPRTAWSFNTALSYYSKNGGIFTVGGFYRDIRNNSSILRILDQPFPGVDQIGIILPPGLENSLFDIRQPVNNTANAQVYGFEAGFNQHFTFLPGFANGFGFSANFTYTESDFVTNLGFDSPLGLPGTSKYSGKAILYYQKYGFTFRATGSYRSNYLSRLGSFGNIGQDITQYTVGNAVFGLNAQYNFNKQINLNASVANLVGTDNIKYLDNDPNNFLNYSALQPIYSLGLLFRF
jgi:TonB-dependent receptor